MEWFWNGFYGGLGYAASGLAIVAAVFGLLAFGAILKMLFGYRVH